MPAATDFKRRRTPGCGKAIAVVWVVVALVAGVALGTFLRRAGEIADEREGRTINGGYPPASGSAWSFRLRLREPSKTTRAQSCARCYVNDGRGARLTAGAPPAARGLMPLEARASSARVASVPRARGDGGSIRAASRMNVSSS